MEVSWSRSSACKTPGEFKWPFLSLTFRNWIRVLDDDSELACSTVTPPTVTILWSRRSDVDSSCRNWWPFQDQPQPASIVLPVLPLAPYPHHLMHTCSDHSHQFLFPWTSAPVHFCSRSTLPEKLFLSSLHIKVLPLLQDPAQASLLHKPF